MTQKQTLWKYCLFFIMIFSTIIAGSAQELCEELSREIFEDTDDNCANALDQNVCYGFDSINASFFEETDNSFSVPSDLVDMLQLQTLRSSEFDPEEEEWGIGYFRIDIEESTDPLIIMATGNVIIENDLASAESQDVNPMQAFNFTTGGPSSCQQAPNAVFIQSPNNVEIDLVVNSVPLRIGSTVVLGTSDQNPEDDQAQDDTMWLAVVEGYARFNANTETEVQVEQGSASTIPLTDENGNNPNGNNFLPGTRVPVINPLTGDPILGPDGQPFYRQVPYQAPSQPQAITPNGAGIFNSANYGFVNNIPSSLLNYDVTVEQTEETPTPVTVVPPAVPPITTEEPILSVDESLTDCGTRNWCNAGERWGDGRCNDPDPNVANWFWTGGWYNAQLECGAIDEIPEEFRPLPTAEPVADAPPPFFGRVVSCNNTGSDLEFVITMFNIPAEAAATNVVNNNGMLVNHQEPVQSTGPETETVIISYFDAPLRSTVIWEDTNMNAFSGNLEGVTSC